MAARIRLSPSAYWRLELARSGTGWCGGCNRLAAGSKPPSRFEQHEGKDQTASALCHEQQLPVRRQIAADLKTFDTVGQDLLAGEAIVQCRFQQSAFVAVQQNNRLDR